MAVFNAIHVSDFHFGSRVARPNLATLVEAPGATIASGRVFRSFVGMHRQATHDPDVVIQVARFLLDRAEAGSLVILSGDIAATGMAGDLETGLAFLRDPPGRAVRHLTATLQPTLAAGAFNVVLLPGNHDRYVSDWGGPGCATFDRIFSTLWGNPSPVVRATAILHADGVSKLGLVAADMCLPSNFKGDWPSSHYGHGRAVRETVDLLVTRTDELRGRHSGIGVCWVLHFPPSLQDGDVPASLALLDQEIVIAAATQSGIRLILAGHTHRSAVVTRGSLTVACAGSSGFLMAKAGHYVHEVAISVDAGVAMLAHRTDYRFEALKGSFVRMP